MSNVDRPSNEILNLLNRFYYSKMTGGYTKKELSNIIIKTGDLIANEIRNGKINNEETIKEVNSFLPKNSNYFKLTHDNLPQAVKTFEEGTKIALLEREDRFGISKGLRI